MLKTMPFLKHLTSSNLVPVCDYDSRSTETYYLALNLYPLLPRAKLSSSDAQTTFRIPHGLQDDLTFHHLPNSSLEAKDLRRFIQSGLLFEYEHLHSSNLSRIQQQELLNNLKNIIDESDIELQADEY